MFVKRHWDLSVFALSFLALPLFFHDSYWMHIINIIGIYALVVIGLDLLVGITGLISLGHALFFALGGYSAGYLTVNYSFSPILSFIVSCILVVAVALVVGVPLIRLKGYYLALGTLGLGIVGFTLLNSGGSITGGPNGFGGIPYFSIGSFIFSGYISNFFLIWGTVLVGYLFAKNLSESATGRSLKAIHSDEGTALIYGIKTNALKIKVFLLSSLYAAVAGIYYAHYTQFMSPENSSIGTSIDMIVMLFLGGLGTIFGPILGAAIYKIIPEISGLFHDYEVLLRGGLLLVILLFFSGGVLESLKKIKIAK